jgi:hypothetical protein
VVDGVDPGTPGVGPVLAPGEGAVLLAPFGLAPPPPVTVAPATLAVAPATLAVAPASAKMAMLGAITWATRKTISFVGLRG